ncbi:hypothetical protein F0562_001421 [Nyssa sinensis]|uniref:Uncharacterized protein n=1 Tax=Nyssa sinensis TaxID=561372 RepID=A0A5J5C7E2_9ASTE|nr:hypothetical protein F0562_001421 [Nyssa sinensis]
MILQNIDLRPAKMQHLLVHGVQQDQKEASSFHLLQPNGREDCLCFLPLFDALLLFNFDSRSTKKNPVGGDFGRCILLLHLEASELKILRREEGCMGP